jgi:hypothetical protein
MASPFSLYVRRSEQLWMLKRIMLAARPPVYHQTLQVILALKAGVADRVYQFRGSNCVGKLENMETGTGKQKSAFTVRPMGGTGRRLERIGLDGCS